MKEIESTINKIPSFAVRFDNAREYWTQAVKSGRLYQTSYFNHVFYSEDSEVYREFCDDVMLFNIAKALNESWIGVNHEGRRDLIDNSRD